MQLKHKRYEVERIPVKTIGILTSPSKTFKMTLDNKVLQVGYRKLSNEFKNKKQSFLNFLGGNFQEINTLASELSSKGEVSVILYVAGSLFISPDFRISPHELLHPNRIGASLDFRSWLDEMDALIISLKRERLLELIGRYSKELDHLDKPCVISTGRSMADELSKQFSRKFFFVERKGVARFGAHNRKKILAFLK